jgi:hypothetical protein
MRPELARLRFGRAKLFWDPVRDGVSGMGAPAGAPPAAHIDGRPGAFAASTEWRPETVWRP